MEVAPTSEHFAVRRRYVYTFCTHLHRLGIDGKWKYYGFHQEEQGLQSGGSRELSGSDTALLH